MIEEGGRPRRRTILAAALSAVIAAAVAYTVVAWPSGVRPPRLDTAAQQTGLRADYDWTFKTLDGELLKLGRFRGKVIVLNFWATWCGPCAEEIPWLQSLYRQVRGHGVAVLPVAVDSTEHVRRFAREQEPQMPVYVRVERLPEDLRSPVMPRTYIIAPDGRVVFRQEGVARWDAPSVVRFLRELAGSDGAPDGA
jgi:peroxiredoxin